jgi:hypothetical protein
MIDDYEAFSAEYEDMIDALREAYNEAHKEDNICPECGWCGWGILSCFRVLE